MNKLCKSYEQKTTHSRTRGQEIRQVFLAITQLQKKVMRNLSIVANVCEEKYKWLRKFGSCDEIAC